MLLIFVTRKLDVATQKDLVQLPLSYIYTAKNGFVWIKSMKVFELIEILNRMNMNDEIFILTDQFNEIPFIEDHIQHDNADGVLFNGN